MGLGTKIKEALHSDHQTSTTPSNTTTSTGSHSTPGAFPSDDQPRKHTDGQHFTAPQGTAVDDINNKAGPHTGATSGATSGVVSSGTQRNRLSKGADEYEASRGDESTLNPGHRTRDPGLPGDQVTSQDHGHASKGAYWGDLPNDGQRGVARDLPDRTRVGEDTAGTTGRHHGTTGHHHDQRLADQAVGGGVYNATPAHGSHGAFNRDPTEDSHFGDGLTGATDRHHGGSGSREHHLAAQPSAGGVYNSVTGSGSPEHSGLRAGQTNTARVPLSSGTQGIPLSSSNTSGNNYDHQSAGLRGDGIPASHDHHAGHSHKLGDTGAAAGLGAAAGYGAHEYGHHSKNDTGYSGNTPSDGLPRSSMLDPEPAANASHSLTGRQPAATGFDGSEGIHGAHGSRLTNTLDPPHVGSEGRAGDIRGAGIGAHSNTGRYTGQSSSGPSDINTNTGTGSGLSSSASPTQSASSGSGRKHVGPGHEGAKVMHSCQHCGQDNDISHYFNKDLVYRLGQ